MFIYYLSADLSKMFSCCSEANTMIELSNGENYSFLIWSLIFKPTYNLYLEVHKQGEQIHGTCFPGHSSNM
jgi:hypothetical protein